MWRRPIARRAEGGFELFRSHGLPVFVIAGLAIFVIGGGLRAATIHPGDLIVADPHGPPTGFNGSIIDINPTTGAQTVISSGGNLLQPNGLCLDAAGNIIVADYGGSNNDNGMILRINPTTGQQSTVATGGLISHPVSVALDSSGNLIVAQSSSLLMIDNTTGAVSTISSGGDLFSVTGLTIDTNGDYLVSNVQGHAGNAVVQVNSESGAQSILTAGGNFANGSQFPEGLAIDNSEGNDLLVAQLSDTAADCGVVAVNTITGEQSVITSGGDIGFASDLAQDSLGDIFVTDQGSFSGTVGKIVEVNPLTGAQSIISSGDNLETPRGIIVVPEPSMSVPLLAGLFYIFGIRHIRNIPILNRVASA